MKILVTGALSGIGYNTSMILAQKGHKVYMGVENEKQLESLSRKVKKINLDIECLKLDITDKSDRYKIKELGLDTIVNNAAIGVGGSLIDTKVDDIRKNFEVNFFSTIELSKLFIDNYDEGNIVVVSSIAGIIPIPFIGSYASTKAALKMYFTILHLETLLYKKNIRIKLVEPGLYHTGFNQLMFEYNDAKLDENNYNKVSSFLEFESASINLLELASTKSIAKKIASAATSKTIKLKYRAPIAQVIFAKIYMLLFS